MFSTAFMFSPWVPHTSFLSCEGTGIEGGIGRGGGGEAEVIWWWASFAYSLGSESDLVYPKSCSAVWVASEDEIWGWKLDELSKCLCCVQLLLFSINGFSLLFAFKEPYGDCFWSHKRFSLNETIRMIAGILIFFFIMTMFQFPVWYYTVGLCTLLVMMSPNLL